MIGGHEYEPEDAIVNVLESVYWQTFSSLLLFWIVQNLPMVSLVALMNGKNYLQCKGDIIMLQYIVLNKNIILFWHLM